MEHDVKVSVILPVYNVGPYISRCIASLKAQTLGELEFIFIDDSSSDGSIRIVEKAADEDHRIRIIYNEKNAGAGPSRNRGIEAAKGEYLSFVDPDDFLSKNFYELLYEKAAAANADIIKGGAQTVVQKPGDPCLTIDDLLSVTKAQNKSKKNSAIRSSLERGLPLWYSYTGEHGAAIYKRSLFESGAVRYGNARVAEDITFQLRAAFAAESIEFEDRATYYYYQREASLSKIADPNRFFALVDSYREWAGILVDHGMNEYSWQYLKRRLHYSMKQFAATKAIAPELADIENEFLLQLSEVFRSIPDISSFTSHSPESRVFVEDAVYIPDETQASAKERSAQWARYFITHPDFDKTLSKEFMRAIIIILLKPDSLPPEARGLTNRISFVIKQIRRILS